MDTVENLNLERFMGRWYVISAVPSFAEKGCTNAYDDYTLNSDGTITIEYHATKKNKLINYSQKASVIDTLNNSKWKIKFTKPYIPFLKAPYDIIILDNRYRYMVVGYPNNKYGWIMSRDKIMDETLYQNILDTLQNKFRYRKNQFVKIIHDNVSSKTIDKKHENRVVTISELYNLVN